MRYQRRLQIQLQEQYRRLYKVDWRSYSNQARYLVDFILRQPALRYLAESLERNLPELNPDTWINEHFSGREHEWPHTEVGKLKVCWHMLNKIAQGEEASHFAIRFSGNNGNMPAAIRAMTEQAIEPLVEYLQEQVGEQSDILYLLEKYRRRVAWFEQNRLWSEVEVEQTKEGRAQVEAIYDRDLRRFLFEQGIDYPFSQPVSASGRADIVSDVESDNPLICEVKLFDGDTYGVPYIAKGLNQALSYAEDYGKTTAYLVVINLTDRPIDLPTDGENGDWPPRLMTGSVTVFLIMVQGKPMPTASARGKVNPWSVDRKDLISS